MRRYALDALPVYDKLSNFDLPIMAHDTFWELPAVSGVVDACYRGDLGRLAAIAPALIDRLDQLPHGMAHGDASPSNFREPGDGTVVAIDWSYGSVAPLGADLGQLVAGHVAIDDPQAGPSASLWMPSSMSTPLDSPTRVWRQTAPTCMSLA